MKKAILSIGILLWVCAIAQGAVILKETKEFKEQEFKTVITITYNSITLEQAQVVEAFVKKKFNDACKVDVELKEISHSDDAWITVSGGEFVMVDQESN